MKLPAARLRLQMPQTLSTRATASNSDAEAEFPTAETSVSSLGLSHPYLIFYRVLLKVNTEISEDTHGKQSSGIMHRISQGGVNSNTY